MEETNSQAAPARAFKLVGESLIVLAQVLLSTLFLLEALFEGGSPRLCQEGETVVYFKIISVPLKQKHTAKYKIYFF